MKIWSYNKMATSQLKDLILRSPAGGEDITYNWPLQIGSGSDRHDNGIDITETIRLVCDDIPEINSAFENFAFNDVDTTCHRTMTTLVDRFNKAVEKIRELEKGTSLSAQRLNKFASPCLLRHILQLVYNAAVSDPDKLNQYEPFSPEVYGETSYDLVLQMIEQVEVKSEDVFIDLGSGVGQVVLQMAGSAPLKACIGIERAEVPSNYAKLMDSHFRLWMNWFGKKFGEYQLIKGDFLADEHREKINSATIVFVNNFAFGPTVDHQLKERFADLKDGARIVSSKSFCPLNFRITDRNLSDIGTIMYVRELAPLKGSVSWTGKPVSYYLHIIDRTKLERYFQRLKSQKAADADNVGSNTRSSRDRAKREAIKSNMDDESSSAESDNAVGPTTRRAWSDWCSSKGKSSQSDDEENNNYSTNSARLSNTRSGSLPKKRKKLTRKAATNQKKEDKLTNAAVEKKTNSNNNNNNNQQRRGRIKRGRGRRNLKIVGLDVLHQETLLSTSVEMMCRKLPPAPGCVDQQLTSLTGDMCHEELEIPTAPSETPYALQILLDMYRAQLMHALDQMKSKGYKENVSKEIEREKERNQRLLNRACQLEKQIKVLIDDSVALLKARMNELGINMTSQNDLLAKAKEIVGRHKELQVMAAKLQNQVNCIEQEQKSLVMRHVQSIADKHMKIKNDNLELTPATSHELVLKEIANTLAQRKKLHMQVSNLEQELLLIEKAAEERKTAVAILSQQNTHLTVTSVPSTANHTSSSTSIPSTTKSSSHGAHSKSRRNREHRSRSQEWPDVPDMGKIEENNPEILAQKILETGRQIEAGKFAGSHTVLNSTSNNPSAKSKEERKQLSNHHSLHSGDSVLMPAPPASASMKAGNLPQHLVLNHHVKSSSNPKSYPANSSSARNEPSTPASKIIQESPKVVNFEDRLKSIITSVLNEDQEQRKAAQIAERKPTPSQQPMSVYMHGNKSNNLPSGGAAQVSTHLNSSTTISPVNATSLAANAPTGVCNAQSQITSLAYKQSQSAASLYNLSKAQQSHQAPIANAHPSPNMSNIQKFFANNMSLNSATVAAFPGSNGSIPGGHQNTQKILYAVQQQVASDLMYRRSLEHAEFKAPENLRFEKVNPQFEDSIRSNSTSSESGMYYPPSSRGSTNGDRNHLNAQQNQHLQQPPSRPSSGSSQPDYTQVSPAKMALRRHLSQEKLAQHTQHPVGGAGNGPMMSSKTIGDLVNGEIERTLEISHQSIINAAVNMSSVGAQSTASPGCSMINPNAQRPERVNVRIPDDHGLVMNPAFSPISRPSSCELRKSPVHLHGQSNLATLAQVAYNHKMMAQQQPNIQQHHANERSNNCAASSCSSRSRTSYPASSAAIFQQQQTQPNRGTNSNREQYTHVALPRAEMKPYLPSYFTDEQKPLIEERSSRVMNGNPPQFEGLAASLQARVIATLNIKQEKEEKQRRSDVHYANLSSTSGPVMQATQIKTECGMKRTSPIIQHPRQSKIPHYSDVHEQLHVSDLSSHSGGRRSTTSMEPPLMSPEINSLTCDDRASVAGAGSSRSGAHFLKQRNEDDDVLPEDETHWQDRISSGFDRLVALASTELDKTRRSIENDTAPSISCNTSPDSGITHGSNSDTRAFLSSSSSSSQLDIAVGPTVSTTGRCSSLSDRRSDSTKCIDTVPIIKTSPTDPIDSPPLSEVGLPRTPSPSPATPPLLPIVANSTSSLLLSNTCPNVSQTQQNTLRIPLRYQRQSSEKHYKKKFRERTWEYDYDDYGYGGEQREDEGPQRSGSPIHHKSSKFRPKGKDWGWSNDGKVKASHEDRTVS